MKSGFPLMFNLSLLAGKILKVLYFIQSKRIHGAMLKPNNSAIMSHSVFNHVKIKSLVPNRAITKRFSLNEKHILDFTTMFFSAILFFNILIHHLNWRQTLPLLRTFAKIYPMNYFVIEIRKHGGDFSINFHYYCLPLLILL